LSFQFTADFFTDKDVCSIVLEVPNSALGSKEIGLLLTEFPYLGPLVLRQKA
jgi:hypothetical protein